MVTVEAYSKWVEVTSMISTMADTVMQALRRLFSTHWLPNMVVMDSGPQLMSAIFQTYLARHGIRHVVVAPYHLASNGLVE